MIKIRETCKLARSALNLASSLVAPGVTTDSIDAEVRRFIIGKEVGVYIILFSPRGLIV